jgi:hypothetical protein
MADETTLYYDGAMNSVGTLQTTCNTDEMNLEKNLQSLDTVLNSGKKVTEAVYKATDPDKLGGLTIKEGTSGGAFTGKAYILTQPMNVVVSR